MKLSRCAAFLMFDKFQKKCVEMYYANLLCDSYKYQDWPEEADKIRFAQLEDVKVVEFSPKRSFALPPGTPKRIQSPSLTSSPSRDLQRPSLRKNRSGTAEISGLASSRSSRSLQPTPKALALKDRSSSRI